MEFRKLVKNTFILDSILSSHHEAGHVILSILALNKPSLCEISSDGGLVTVDSLIDPSDFEKRLIARSLVAGRLAEEKIFREMTGTALPERFLKHSEEDFVDAIEILASVKKHVALDLIVEETNNKLNKNWSAVRHLANELYQRRKMSYEDIKQNVIKHGGIKWRALFFIIDLMRNIEDEHV